MNDTPNIVHDCYYGNTHIMIADNYCVNKTDADVDRILRRIAQKVRANILAGASEEKYA